MESQGFVLGPNGLEGRAPASNLITSPTQPVTNLLERLAAMDFAHRRVAVRKQRDMTRLTLADAVGAHVTQLRRHEARTNQPTLEVLRALAGLSWVARD